MAKKICLFKDMVCATSLTYDEACKAMHLANHSKMGEHFDFFICGWGVSNWQLKARHIHTSFEFITSTEDYMIEV